MIVLRAVAAAWLMLTAVPLPARWRAPLGDADWRRGAAAFPFVGALLGGLLAVLLWGCSALLGAPAAAALTVIAGALLTGGLHLDGLADCADACGARGSGAAQRARRLEILRDSATGTYGTLALVGALLLQWSLLATLATSASLGHGGAAALVVAVAVGRSAGLLHVGWLPAARSDGLGASFSMTRGAQRSAFAATLVIVAAAMAASALAAAADLTAAAPLLALAMALLATVGTTRLARGLLGGRTGDTIGATIVVSELAALLAFVAVG